MKKKVLRFLKDNTDRYYSGTKISEKLGVSRTAVWKIINKLRKSGYKIDSVSSKGYKLVSGYKDLNEEELSLIIEKYDFLDKSFYYKSIDSTNDFLKRKSDEFQNKNLLCISDIQKKGKGRLGRNWQSENGLYMSYLLRPVINPLDATLFTQIGAAAVVKTFNKLTDLEVKIKWPNDIVVNHKKICGILTEMDAELNQLNYLILGIGINLNNKKFSGELKEKATSYYLEKGKNLNKKTFLETFLKYLNNLLKDYLENGNINASLEICKKYSNVISKKVRLVNKNSERIVKVIDINEKGQLVVLNKKDEKEIIFTGEISIRGLNKKYI
ncbi:MAG: biotin--[acetyl-CoA-carboxylase] ligase [Bacillota bacterium]